ncbi:MAG TPA: SDR family oxidoreductase [Acidimicrobiales bacterium]|jgi:NAD(P)-dependent dehydrogenase (short-subunit alcohol dehydrogenase family)|nr:SDR family oxidoreductase [Acidimicrobiales bacterium]
MDTPPLHGLTALVSGAGASIGLATARSLARDGASVLMTGVDDMQLRAAAGAVRDVAAADAVVDHTVADSTHEDDVARAVAQAGRLPGQFAICVSAVGHTTMAPVLHYTVDEWWHDLRSNVVSAFLTLKHAGAAMRSHGGAFVAVSSHAGTRSMRSLASYCASKAALEMMVRVAADELGEHGIRVNAVRPGLTRREQASPIFGYDDLESAYLANTPLRRHGRPDDTAAAVRFLAGPESSWITGQCLTVDGGLELRGAPNLKPAARRVRGDALFEAAEVDSRPAPPARAGGLQGASAMVTGGGSSIGLASARMLAREGARVSIVGRRADRLRDACERLADQGLTVRWTAADVTDEVGIEGAVRDATNGTGRLDVCVASAGGATMSPILDCDLDRFLQPFTLNVIGSYLTLRHACRAMTSGGSFVAISSESAVVPIRGLAAYCASKAALDMLVRVAADELGDRGIRVNSVRPGLTRREAPSPIFGDAELMSRFREQTPLLRSGTADDSAYAVRYFAGLESAWVTGQCLTIDGGMDLRGAPDLSMITERFRAVVEAGEP